MARRRNAAAPRTVAEEPSGQQDAGSNQLQEKRGHQVQRRRGGQQQAAKKSDAAQPVEPFVDPVTTMSWYTYYPRQYGGLLLGMLACFNTLYFYEKHDPWLASKMLAWMFVALAGLAIHEFRPFKRMTYEDKAKESGVGWRRVLLGC